jgi:hypothetical protein
MASQVRAVRLPTPLAKRLERVAEQAGGRGRAVDVMLSDQPLPPRSWFGNSRGRGRMACPARVTLRLSSGAVKKLREVTGRRSLSEGIRLLILYTFTDGAAGDGAPPAPAPPVPVARPTPIARPHALNPVTESSMAGPVRPPSRPTAKATQRGFEHLPPLPPGQRYACEERGCEFGVVALGGGMTTRCRRHSGL